MSVEKFTFCQISRKGPKVFSKEGCKMYFPPSLKVIILWTILEAPLSQTTVRAWGHMPQAGREEPHFTGRLLGCRVDPGCSCSLKVFVVVFQWWFLTWTGLSLQHELFWASVWMGYSGLPLALCLMDRESSGSGCQGVLLNLWVRKRLHPTACPALSAPEVSRCLGEMNFKNVFTPPACEVLCKP